MNILAVGEFSLSSFTKRVHHESPPETGGDRSTQEITLNFPSWGRKDLTERDDRLLIFVASLQNNLMSQ